MFSVTHMSDANQSPSLYLCPFIGVTFLREWKDPLNWREASALKLLKSLSAGNFSRAAELSFRWTPGKLHFHSLPTGVSLRRSFRRGQPRAGQCQLWSVCWCLYLPGSAVCRRDQRGKRGTVSKKRNENTEEAKIHSSRRFMAAPWFSSAICQILSWFSCNKDAVRVRWCWGTTGWAWHWQLEGNIVCFHSFQSAVLF